MKIALLIILAYLLGSIPSGVIIGNVFYHKDIRAFGSHNIGTTNTFRVLGIVPGTIVLFMDILKGTLATYLPILLGYPRAYLHGYFVLIIGLFAVLGHCYSIFIKFKGGKAVATSAGLLLGYNPQLFLIAIVIFGILLALTSMVSVASMIGAILIVLASLFYHDPILTGILAIIAALLIYRHRANMNRIRHGDENMVPFGLVYHLKKRQA